MHFRFVLDLAKKNDLFVVETLTNLGAFDFRLWSNEITEVHKNLMQQIINWDWLHPSIKIGHTKLNLGASFTTDYTFMDRGLHPAYLVATRAYHKCYS